MPPSGEDSAWAMARASVTTPSWVGVAWKEAPTQAYTAGRICSSHLQPPRRSRAGCGGGRHSGLRWAGQCSSQPPQPAARDLTHFSRIDARLISTVVLLLVDSILLLPRSLPWGCDTSRKR